MGGGDDGEGRGIMRGLNGKGAVEISACSRHILGDCTN